MLASNTIDTLGVMLMPVVIPIALKSVVELDGVLQCDAVNLVDLQF